MDPGMIPPMVSGEVASLAQAITIVAEVYLSFIAIAVLSALAYAIYHRNDKE